MQLCISIEAEIMEFFPRQQTAKLSLPADKKFENKKEADMARQVNVAATTSNVIFKS